MRIDAYISFYLSATYTVVLIRSYCIPHHFVTFAFATMFAFILPFLITITLGLVAKHENTDNTVSINIVNSQTGQIIQPTMHGMILETNINRGDDGGLYAELIYNRAFQGQSNCSVVPLEYVTFRTR